MTENLFIAKVIKANAGSGKTYELTRQYLKLLFQGESVDHILATTFTKKAAGEILSRILKRLAEAILNNEKEKELLKSLNLLNQKISTEKCFDDFIKLQHKILISTMDSFFAKIATSFSVELGLNGNLRISEENEKEKIYTETIRKLCQEEEAKELSSLIRDFNDGEEKNSIDMELKEKLSSLYDIFICTPKGAWEEIKSKRNKASDKEIEVFIQRLISAPLTLTKAGKPNERFIQAIKNLIEQVRKKEFNKCCSEGLCKAVISGENKYYNVEISPAIVSILHELIDIIEAEFVDKLNRKTKALYNLLSKYVKFYEELRNKKSIIGFSDLKYILKNVVEKEKLEEIYYRLDTSVKHILLDEFQDTSLVEWELIEPIIDEILSGGEKTFFCVGDPKQAIYGWRGGVAEIFEKITPRWPHVKLEELKKSYRSSPVIIDFVNLICKNLQKTKLKDEYLDVALSWDENFPIHQAQLDIKGHVFVEGVCPPPKNEDTKENVYDVIIEKASQKVCELAKQNHNISIGVLCRSNNFVNKMITSLKGEPYNLSISQEGGVPLLDSKAVVFILAVLKYMNHTDDSLCEYEINLLASDIIKNKEIFFKDLRKRFISNGFFNVVSFLKQKIQDKISTKDNFKMEKLLELCISYDRDAIYNIDDFINNVRSARVEEPSTSNIKVMTIHKAKGLEFDAVILPELDGSMLKQAEPLTVYYDDRTEAPKKVFAHMPTIGKINEEIGKIEHQENALKIREALCILYVALTRAKQHLSIFMPIKKTTKTLNCADFILNILNPDFENNNFIYEVGDKNFYEQKEKIINTEIREKKKFQAFQKQKERKNLIIKNPSSAEGEGFYDIKNRFNLNVEQVLKKGSLYHKFYEQVDWIDKDDFVFDKKIFLDNELADNFSDIELDQAYSKFLKSFEYPKVKNRFLKSFYDKWNVDRVDILKEEQFIFRDGEVAFKGFIDRAILGYKEDKLKNIEIIDFKSDSIDNEDTISKKALFYKPQIDIYREALKRRFSKDKVDISACLLFVSVGEDYTYTYGNNNN